MDIKTAYNDDNYTIHVGHNIYDTLIHDYTKDYKDVYYIIDEYVYELYETKFSQLNHVIKAPRGEAFKHINPVMNTIDSLLDLNIKRNSLIVVIGGGATGDAGALLSSIILRGVDYIHVPTTLLSHDSSVGGKTAINRPHGKNLVGTFYRPKAVIFDLNFLKTLDDEEILSGFGEVIKHAMLNDQITVENLMHQNRRCTHIEQLEPFIITGIKTKLRYVTEDETESNVRKALNLGHTLGHALEYEYQLKHGHAVVLGLLFMLYVSNERLNKSFNLQKYVEYFKSVGYDVSYLNELNIPSLIERMSHDKKNNETDKIQFVLLEAFGTPKFDNICIDELTHYLKEFQEII
uniref:3-dehydroquinate synthase n=1 Tax=Nosocomiicoccus ampullae TaxID=489910 RepID=UPI000835BB3B|nr:3-dehydroquinate synthase family protein [Nosocomiicoccus ampullae]